MSADEKSHLIYPRGTCCLLSLAEISSNTSFTILSFFVVVLSHFNLFALFDLVPTCHDLFGNSHFKFRQYGFCFCDSSMILLYVRCSIANI